MPTLYVDDGYVVPGYVQTGITINWGTREIFVPRSELTLVQSSPSFIYSLDLNEFRLALKDLEDDAEGMTFPTTHNHNTTVTVGGVTLARVIEIINGYTVTFEDGQYAVNLLNANSNVGDVVNVNQVSVRAANSAGLIVTSEAAAGLTTDQAAILELIYQRLGLRSGKPLVQSQTEISTTDFVLAVTEGAGTVTVERQP